jgi:hypothetical protein
MRYIVIPRELFDTIPEEIKKKLGIDSPRMSTDGTEVMLHIEHYDTLFPPVMTLEEDDNSDIVYPFPTYDATSTEFNSLIASDKWSANTEDYDI